jgi:aminomuconate-semialdehyde/2-hydroxymuconate-6-semialdehyde dehydrogenase
MGGKNAAIVFRRCDFDVAIEATLRSCFENCGQVCLGTERVYVERPMFETFVAALKKGAEGLKLGVPDDPPATWARSSARNTAPRCSRTTRRPSPKAPRSSPAAASPRCRANWRTALGSADHLDRPGDDRGVAREEIFGPCCHIMPFDSEEEVIKRANATATASPRRSTRRT